MHSAGRDHRRPRMAESRSEPAQRPVNHILPDKLPPGVDLSAPIIHFGTTREVTPRQSLKDQHFVRAQDEKAAVALVPQTKESKLLTLFVGGIPADLDDSWLEKIFKVSALADITEERLLREIKSCAKFQGWKRVLSGTGKGQTYGFVTYEDPENLKRAHSILKDLKLPLSRRSEERQPLMVTQDPISELYVEDYLAAKGVTINEQKERNSVLSAIGQVEKVVKDFSNSDIKPQGESSEVGSLKGQKEGTTNVVGAADAVTIMLSIEDELGDIPEEQRANIAKEITSFRERSARRDQERALQIADLESRRLEYERANRNDNRRQKEVEQGTESIVLIRRPKKKVIDYSEQKMSETEIANRRAAIHLERSTALYEMEEKLWRPREEARIRALKVEADREEEEQKRARLDSLYQLERFEKFDDDKEAHRAAEAFYQDRAAWARIRSAARSREQEMDEQDEARYLDTVARRQQRIANNTSHDSPPANSKGQADSGPLKFAIGKAQEEAKARVVPNSEVLLENDDDTPKVRRTLIPITYEDVSEEVDGGSAGEKQQSSKLSDLAEQIPTEKEALWDYPVAWSLFTPDLEHKLRAFVGKKIEEVIGMEEEELIAVVMSIIEARGSGKEIEQELVAAIGDAEDSAMAAVKIWRFLLLLLASVM